MGQGDDGQLLGFFGSEEERTSYFVFIMGGNGGHGSVVTDTLVEFGLETQKLLHVVIVEI